MHRRLFEGRHLVIYIYIYIYIYAMQKEILIAILCQDSFFEEKFNVSLFLLIFGNSLISCIYMNNFFLSTKYI